jgi:hypothetical protein
MKVVQIAVLWMLIFLAVSSGISKIVLMQQDVDFFGKFGFATSVLVAFGFAQLVGGLLMIAPKTRIPGTVVVAISFLISAVLLFLDGNYIVAAITLIATAGLAWILRSTRSNLSSLQAKRS